MEEQFCQSCGLPLTEEHYSKNADGSANMEFCAYCYKDGAFAQNVTMEQMIDHCLEFIDEFNADSDTKFTKEEAREQMMQHFPTLKRWQA